MAIIQPTSTFLKDLQVTKITWANLLLGDEGAPIESLKHTDRSVQVDGTFGGATVGIKGTVGGISYQFLTDPQGNDLSIGSEKIEAITELVHKIKPVVSGGDGTTDLTVSMIVKIP